MKIKLNEISIRDVTKSYIDNDEEGVVGYNGKLNIRPKYQREFIYNEKERNAVIDTIQKGFPLNTMYWVVNGDGNFEVLDGQQRTVSFCQYVNGNFSVYTDGYNKAFQNLTEQEQNQILDYKLMIFFCEGNDKEKLDWFNTINIAGETHNKQELRNAVYAGTWLTAAKTIFSKSNCVAYLLAKDYVKGILIRQVFLETALKWISNGDIEGYMSTHQHDTNANELWTHFKNVIEWIMLTFITCRHKEMKEVNWGELYDEFKNKLLDPLKLEQEIKLLMMDYDVTNKKGIYPYVLTRKEKYLNIRPFNDNQKREAYERQKGVCTKCGEHFEIEEMEGDHIKPWIKGGHTEARNCQMLCTNCNGIKAAK
jgi:hypothetical protein